jgi:UDP-3-O-[3-hydroxymyristoyl] glucosamine N-acyltransferase
VHSVDYRRDSVPLQHGLHIAGTGSFAAEVAGWVADAGIEVAGLIELEDPSRAGSVIHGLPVVPLDGPPTGGRAILGLGGDRRDNWERVAAAGWPPAGVIHPTAQVASTAEIAPSATVGPLAVIGAETAVGEHAILSRGALLGHHVRIGEFATLNPGVNVGGNSEVGAGAFLGIGCVVVNGTVVGGGATIAAGAVAIREVAAGTRVQGVPAVPYEGR